MRAVDRVFSDRISVIEGFEAYHSLDCGRGEIVSVSLVGDQSACEESDEQALVFVDEQWVGLTSNEPR